MKRFDLIIPAQAMQSSYTQAMNEIQIRTEPVELFKILKFEGLAASGGEAKLVIAEGLVQVNGQVETQKRKKIKSGDQIDFNNQSFTIVMETKE